MDPRFLEINGVVVNVNHIVEVDFSTKGAAVMHMSSGNCRTFTDDDAVAARAFWTADNTAQRPDIPGPAADSAIEQPGPVDGDTAIDQQTGALAPAPAVRRNR